MTMEQKSSPVNTRRRYDSSGRRKRACQTRDLIADAARQLFLADGYAATTVAAIAAAKPACRSSPSTKASAESPVWCAP